MASDLVPLLALPAFLAAVGGVAWLVRWSQQAHLAWLERLTAAGTRLGLRFVPAERTTPERLEGRIDGLRVVVDTFQRSTGKLPVLYSRIRVETDVDLRIVPEGFWKGLSEAVFGTDVPVGDPAFDGAVHLAGDPEAISAIFDPVARSRVKDAIGRGACHDHGGWEWTRQGFFGSADEIVAHVRALVAAGEVVRAPTSGEALVRRVADDPVPGVRAQAAERLLDRLERAWDPALGVALASHLPPGRSAARLARLRVDDATLRAHLADPDPETRSLAAVALAARGQPGEDPALEEALRGLVAGQDLEVIGALGRIGTVGSVAALRPVADRAFTASGAHTAAREAIRAIQGRVAGASEGQLSIAAVAGGALSEGVPAVDGAVAEVGVADEPHRRAAAAARRAGTPEPR
jgi:hypothetical protein